RRRRPNEVRSFFPNTCKNKMAQQVGLEPTTLRLTAECSAIELLRNKRPHTVTSNYVQGAKRFYNRRVFERQPLPTPLNLRSESICENISSPYSPTRKVLQWNAAQLHGLAQTSTWKCPSWLTDTVVPRYSCSQRLPPTTSNMSASTSSTRSSPSSKPENCARTRSIV